MTEIPTEALEAAARAIATLVERRHHSQLCPVWVSKAEVQRCTCWILTRARAQATAAAPYLIAEGRRQAAAEIRERSVDVAARAEAMAGSAAGASFDHPFALGCEWAAPDRGRN